MKIILDPKFWNDSRVIVHILSTLNRLLRIADSDEHLEMGYVYDGMYRAIDGIQKLCKDKKKFLEPHILILSRIVGVSLKVLIPINWLINPRTFM